MCVFRRADTDLCVQRSGGCGGDCRSGGTAVDSRRRRQDVLSCGDWRAGQRYTEDHRIGKLELAGFTAFEHLQLAEMGLEKGKSPADAANIAKAAAKGKEMLS